MTTFINHEVNEPIYYDTETCGLHGPVILIQWAQGDGEVHLWDVWKEPALDTMKLIEEMMNNPGGIVGFNLAFDHFHLCQLFTTLSLLKDSLAWPEDCIEEYARAEPIARDGQCLKPTKACDIMLHARKGPYQSTMERSDIRIKRIPTPLAWQLAAELDKRIPLSDALFARRADKHAPKWKVYDLFDDDEEMIPDFKDVVLSFAPSNALKVLAADALKKDPRDILLFADVSLPKAAMPVEYGYAPFAMASAYLVEDEEDPLALALSGKISEPQYKWAGTWPDVIKMHINHWAFHKTARAYATLDVEMTRDLYKYFGSPELGDDDSELACMVGAVRWKGFRIDAEGIKELKAEAKAKIKKTPIAPRVARKYIHDVMDPTERLTMGNSTNKIALEKISKMVNILCVECDGTGRDTDQESCIYCSGNGKFDHPAAIRAQEIIDARKAGKEVELYDKLLKAGRFHASFNVIGTLSSRMSGTDKLNAQGINKSTKVRSKFPLAWPDTSLCGGDFSGFEVVLAEACYNDPDLRADLLTGKKIHGLFGVFVYPHLTYEELLATEGTSEDLYTRAKSAVFAMLYGGEGFTLQERLGVALEIAEEAYRKFCKRYPGVGRARQRVIDMFCTLKQPGGIGSKVEWHEPADFIESMFGFRRFFTLENRITRVLFELAENPPKAWKDLKIKFTRRDREQWAVGALQSALFGASFALQASNMRAAANHEIQSSGAQVTKHVQRRIWDLQPAGIGEWIVQPMNVHDEIETVVKPGWEPIVKQRVDETVESYRARVPLIKMEWKSHLPSWAGKSA